MRSHFIKVFTIPTIPTILTFIFILTLPISHGGRMDSGDYNDDDGLIKDSDKHCGCVVGVHGTPGVPGVPGNNGPRGEKGDAGESGL